MKSIVVNAVINNTSVNLEAVRAALQALGADVSVSVLEEFETVQAPKDHTIQWIYISPDESEPYLAVSGPQESEGSELSDAQVDELRKTGVCVEMFVRYPDVDTYGMPSHALSDDVARGYVGDHLFAVAETQGSFLSSACSHDDTPESVWLGIAIPA